MQTRIAAALGVEEEEAERIYNRILADRNPGAPSKYVDSLIASGDIAQYGTKPKPSTYTGPRCEFVEDEHHPGYCATCKTPAGNRRHGQVAT